MKEEAKKFKVELLKSMVQLSTAGFGFVAALAWNETIQEAIKRVLPSESGSIISKLVYAIIVTTMAVIVTYTLSRATEKANNEENKK